MKFKSIIDEAGRLVKDSDLGRLKVIANAWNTIEWKEVPHIQGSVACHDRDPNIINIFGGFTRLSPQEQLEAVVAAFGVSVFERFSPKEAVRCWEHKLTLPEASQVEAVQEKLRNASYATYRTIMESFDRLMDRFVSLNLTNALAAGGIKREQAININLRQWGSTLEYANCRKVHSLCPYVTAYGPKNVAECPGHGLAEKLVYKMGHITESSLATAYGRLISEVFTLC